MGIEQGKFEGTPLEAAAELHKMCQQTQVNGPMAEVVQLSARMDAAHQRIVDELTTSEPLDTGNAGEPD